MSEKKVYGIVGDGKMASHFCRYLDLCGVDYISWSRRADVGVRPFDKLKNCQLVCLLISDGAIGDFLEQNRELKNLRLVHFSGSLFLEGVPSYHPLMTFAKRLYSRQEYQKIPFVYEQGQPTFAQIFPKLPNESFPLQRDKKPLYHALCVLSGNFTTLLWQKVFGEFERQLGLEPKILFAYMQQIFENLQDDWKNALSGPLSRGDKSTIDANLNALQGDNFAGVYRAFVQALDKGGKL